MNIKTLSDAVTIIEFLISKQGKSVEAAIEEAGVPLHLKEQVVKYFAPPLEITAPDLILGKSRQIPLCNPDTDSMQQYFGALRRYLIEVKGRSKSTVETLTETSLDLVKLIPKPYATDEFQSRGLVVGHIQSGKTAMMAALIARAADEGYKLFIVFGGAWKDLRSQTQCRLDQEITGESEDSSDGPFVIHEGDIATWSRLTQSGLEGDFAAGTTSDLNPQRPQLAVIKKNKRIETLKLWLEKTHAPLKDLPALIIDDECDQGSIDTNYGKTDDEGNDLDPTSTNGRIRDLLAIFPKCVYVGFTATPFANVLIDAKAEDDLYPRDFIATLPEPLGYFGPRKLFGLGMNPSDLSPDEKEEPLLDVIKNVTEHDANEIDLALESGAGAPTILANALLTFVLSSCARMARGQGREHFSMLVHPSQYTEPHTIFSKAISDELELLKGAAVRPKKFPNIMQKAEAEWEILRQTTRDQGDAELPDYDFDKIWKFAKELTESIEIKILNGQAGDRLDYRGTPKRYVVVGGNKLSRGLTLEGLSVSVFTRTTNTYDTLLQMGRWFGFRPGYYDLTRIYVSNEMEKLFADLARVEEDFRADLKKYAQKPNPPTPLELVPRIRSHPSMAVTSKMKMGAGHAASLSFENTSQQTVNFPIDKKNLLLKNINAARAFINGLSASPQSSSEEGMHVWTDVPSTKVIEFLREYEFSPDARAVNKPNLEGYINRLNKSDELTSWDVVLPKGSSHQDIHPWTKDIFTRKIERKPTKSGSIKVLSSPSDKKEWLEMTGRDPADPTRGCLMLHLIDKDSGKQKGLNFFKNSADAEDILGLVLIFPESDSHEAIEYVSQ